MGGEEYKIDAMLESITISQLSCEFIFMTPIGTEMLSKGDGYHLDGFSVVYGGIEGAAQAVR